MNNNYKNVWVKHIVLACAATSLLACQAENFFSEGDSYTVSGTFTLANGQYLDKDAKGETSSNAFNSAQGVDGPATIGGYVSKSSDTQDCYALGSEIEDGDTAKLTVGDGIATVQLAAYRSDGLARAVVTATSGDKEVNLDLESGDDKLCAEINSTDGDRIYTLEIDNDGAISVTDVKNLTALLVNSNDNVRSTVSVAPTGINNYSYELNGLENSTYSVYLSSDIDNDNIYCEQGDMCGELSVGTLTGDLTGQDFSDVEICTSSSGCGNIDNN